MKKLKSNVRMMTEPQKKLLKSTNWREGKTAAERGYDYKWQKYRKQFLFNNPLCVYCEKLGKISVATVVDHIIPHRGDKSLFWDLSNHQALCQTCHSSIKQKEEKGR